LTEKQKNWLVGSILSLVLLLLAVDVLHRVGCRATSRVQIGKDQWKCWRCGGRDCMDITVWVPTPGSNTIQEEARLKCVRCGMVTEVWGK